TSSRLTTLPVAFRGSSSTNSTSRGTLKPARLDLTYFLTSSSLSFSPSLVATKALSAWPNFSSSTPTTATSLTASCLARRSSTSAGNTFSPPETIISSSRPSTNSRPSSSTSPTSPVDINPPTTSLLPPPV